MTRYPRRSVIQGKTPRETIEALMLRPQLLHHRGLRLPSSINNRPYALFAAGFTAHVENTQLR